MYLQALIQLDHASSEEEKNLCLLWLNDLNPGGGFKVREVDEFLAISHWVHMAILAMTDLKDAVVTPEQIYRKLNRKVPLHEVRCALARLTDLGLVAERDGRLSCTGGRVTTRDDVSNRGAREYHKQVAQLAALAVEEQSVDEREFQSFAVSVPANKIGLAKEMIRKFRTQFCQMMTAELGDEVYQTNIQFFRLTESPSEMVPKEDEGAGSETQKPLVESRSTCVH